MAAAAPSFLEDVRFTEDGFLWLQSDPNQQKDPPLLPHSLNLWRTLHAPINTNQAMTSTVLSARNNLEAFATHELRRSKGLAEAIRGSIGEIEQMKDIKSDVSMRQSVNRLKQQQTTRLQQANVGRQVKDQIEQEAYFGATVRTIKTLNSIRAIFPLLIRMFHHEERNNRELEIPTRDKHDEVIVDNEGGGGVMVTLETIVTQKSKGKIRQNLKNNVWLLGDYVYDVAKKGQFRFFNECLWRVMECFLTEQEIFRLIDLKDVSDSFWATLFPKFIEDQRARTRVPSPTSLFEDLPLEQRERVLDVAKACDERYLNVFHHKNEDAQRTRVLYQAAVDRLIGTLRSILRHRFRGSEVRVYGSCLSNLSLGKSSDVDISLHLPAFARLKQLFETGEIGANVYEKEMKNHVYRTNGLLCGQYKNGLRMHDCVTRARVPVIKGTYLYAGNPYSPDGSLDFDICFSNEIAIMNSALLSEYTLADERIKCFLLSVKAWARHYQLSSAADNRISSYAWVNLGIFYLQCIGFVPNLQCRDFMAQHGFELDQEHWSHRVDDLDTGFMPWQHVAGQNIWSLPKELQDTPVTLLMYGFFHFYTRHFPTSLFAVSIREGRIKLPRASFDKVRIRNLCVEDPFETHCSHCPHDLAKPTGENGYKVIEEVMRDSESFLRHALAPVDDIPSESSFWRLCEVAGGPRTNFNPAVFPIPVHSTKGHMDGRSVYDRGGSMMRFGRKRLVDNFEEEKKSVSGDQDLPYPVDDGDAIVDRHFMQRSTHHTAGMASRPELHAETSPHGTKPTTVPKSKGGDQRHGSRRSKTSRRTTPGKNGPQTNSTTHGSTNTSDRSKKDKSTATQQSTTGSKLANGNSDERKPSKVPKDQANRTKKKSSPRGGRHAGRGSGSSRRSKKPSAACQKKNGATNGNTPTSKQQGATNSKATNADKQ